MAQQETVPPAVEESAADPLLAKVDEAIRLTSMRNLDFQQHRPWQILHGLLALRENYTIKNGNEFVNALDFLSKGARFKGDTWFEVTAHGGKAHPYNGTPYDFEGHVNQTLAIIAMCNVPLTHTFQTNDGRTVTMADMIRHAQMNVNTREELTWTLWFLTHYLDQDTTWVAADGQRWSMETLVRHQNNTNVYNAPCGGCHNLFALAYARNSFMQKHGVLRGVWLEADQKIQQYITASQTMQNRDGSFATQYYKARGQSTDFNERIKSSGHILEWLMVGMPRKRLDEPWLRLGVQTLANDMITNASQPADCGPLYHSLHALILYKQRMQAGNDAARKQDHMAAKPQAGAENTLPPLGSDGTTTVRNPQQTRQQNPLAVPPAPAATAPAILGDSTQLKRPADSEFKAPFMPPLQTPAPVQIVPNTLQAAQPSTPPVLVQPPQNSSSQTPRILPRRPTKVAEQDRLLRRLSTEGEEADAPKAEQADQNVVVPTLLSPVPGGLPMLVKPVEPKPSSTSPVEVPVTSETPAPASGSSADAASAKAGTTPAPADAKEIPVPEAKQPAAPVIPPSDKPADAPKTDAKSEKETSDKPKLEVPPAADAGK